jgi:chemotaxis protein methyltransferase CheR
MDEHVPTESRFFQHPGFYLALRSAALPILRTYPRVRVWHPGCGPGEEVYSTAIVLHEEGLIGRCLIYATDEDPGLLLTASRGIYPAPTLLQAEARYTAAGGRGTIADYCSVADGAAEVLPLIRERITFAQHSLATDASPNEFQLIICRDGLVGLDPALAERAFQLFHDSLCRLGYLGFTQGAPLHPYTYEGLYVRVADKESLYRRTH